MGTGGLTRLLTSDHRHVWVPGVVLAAVFGVGGAARAEKIDQSRSVYCVRFSPDGKRVLSGGASRRIQLWDAESGRELKSFFHPGWVQVVAFSPDGRQCVSGSRDCKMRLWDLTTGEEVRSFAHGGWVGCALFLPDGKRCLSLGGDGGGHGQAGIRVWDSETGRELRNLDLEGGKQSSVGWGAASKDGKVLAVAAGKAVAIWDIPAGRLIRRIEGHTKGIWELALSADGKTCISGGMDNTIRLWRVEDGRCLGTIRQSGVVRAVAISPDGELFATGGTEYAMPRTARPRAGRTIRPAYLIRLWDLGRRRGLRRIAAHRWLVESLDFSPDGKTLVSGSFDGTVKLWHVRTGRLVRSLQR